MTSKGLAPVRATTIVRYQILTPNDPNDQFLVATSIFEVHILVRVQGS